MTVGGPDGVGVDEHDRRSLAPSCLLLPQQQQRRRRRRCSSAACGQEAPRGKRVQESEESDGVKRIVSLSSVGKQKAFAGRL